MGSGGSPGLTPVGVGFLSTLVVTGWTALTVLLTPFLLLALIPVPEIARIAQPIYRRVTHFTQWAWMANVVLLLEHVYGIHVTVTGDAVTKANEHKLIGERAFWLSNHRTRIDWMLLWSLALRTHTLDQIKIILKAPLRKIPVFGWAMQHFLFIFLDRRWADDEKNLETFLPFLTTHEPGSSYLIFPEGTDLSESNVEKSRAFAAKNGQPPRTYSLYPRTTGWTFMFSKLQASLDAVYDITMFYVDHTPNERPSEASLLSGRMPRAIHFYVERIAIENMPHETTELSKWVEQRFAIKEAHLKAFYEDNGRLPNGAVPLLTSNLAPSLSLLVAFWLVFLTLACQWAWNWGLVSVVFGILVAIGYAVATFVLSGVDGILRKTL